MLYKQQYLYKVHELAFIKKYIFHTFSHTEEQMWTVDHSSSPEFKLGLFYSICCLYWLYNISFLFYLFGMLYFFDWFIFLVHCVICFIHMVYSFLSVITTEWLDMWVEKHIVNSWTNEQKDIAVIDCSCQYYTMWRTFLW